MNLEESETDESDQIENPIKLNMSNIQEPREDENIEDADTDIDQDSQTIENYLEESEIDKIYQI